MINVQNEYRGLLSGVLHGGAEKKDRTGTGTRAVFGRVLRHNMELGFPLLTAKKIFLFRFCLVIRGRYLFEVAPKK